MSRTPPDVRRLQAALDTFRFGRVPGRETDGEIRDAGRVYQLYTDVVVAAGTSIEQMRMLALYTAQAYEHDGLAPPAPHIVEDIKRIVMLAEASMRVIRAHHKVLTNLYTAQLWGVADSDWRETAGSLGENDDERHRRVVMAARSIRGAIVTHVATICQARENSAECADRLMRLEAAAQIGRFRPASRRL